MKSRTMRAVGVVPGKREVRVVDHPAPAAPNADEVKVRSLEVGICGTDREICTFAYGSPPDGCEYLVLGHESLGEVVEVGKNVKDLKPGDLVTPSVRRPCQHHHCVPCRVDRQDFCFTSDFTERGIKMRHGYLTEYWVEEEKYLTFVPAELRDVAVLVEPLTVAEKGLTQVWQIQKRLPWECPVVPGKGPGHCRTAVVLGAGPIGILGAMVLVAHGFKTFVYSRASVTRNPKADLVESFGAKYVSAKETSVEKLAHLAGNIDVVYEAVGTADISFELLKVLGMNGVFVFTGIPAPHGTFNFEGSVLMRNLVLKNQTVVGTVNADKGAFEAAIRDLQIFKQRWPAAIRSLVSGRHKVDSYRDLLLGKPSGIKNVISFE